MRIPTIVVAIAAVLVSGCSTFTPRERAIAVGVAAVAVAGAIEASRRNHSDPTWNFGRGAGPAMRP